MAETTYVARRVLRDPCDAATLVATRHRGLSAVPGMPHYVNSGNRLWVRLEAEPIGPDPFELYAVRGILWVGLCPVAVTFEVSVWSATETQVGLRPKRLSWPTRTRRFARYASRALDDLADDLSCPALHRPGQGLAAPTAASRRDQVLSAA